MQKFHNLTNITYNLTKSSVREYKCIFKIINIKKEISANLSERRLSEAVSVNHI